MYEGYEGKLGQPESPWSIECLITGKGNDQITLEEIIAQLNKWNSNVRIKYKDAKEVTFS